MMKITVLIFAVVRLLFGAFTVAAATATPNAASDYLFSTPHHPEAIRGLVMGSPPAYYVVRSEDFDWLNEALRERLAYMTGDLPDGTNTTLAAEFGKWDLDATNRFHRWGTSVDAAGVTNVVIGYHLVTNTPPTIGSPGATIYDSSWLIGDAAVQLWNPAGGIYDGYLDPDVPLATGAHAYNRNQAWTNIYSIASYTNALTNTLSTITMPMTNGTVSVHTNQWRGYIQLPCDIVYTNVIYATTGDFCHADSGPFPGYTNAQPIAFYGPRNLTRIAVPSIISNDYVALRGAVRLADRINWPTNAPARSTSRRHSSGVSYTNYQYSSYADIAPSTWTNDYASVSTDLSTSSWLSYSLELSHSEWETSVIYEDGGLTKREVVTERSISRQERDSVLGTAVFRTRFPSSLATIGGTTRIAVEAMYADVYFHYRNYCLTNNDNSVEISTNVILRLAGPTLDVSGPKTTVNTVFDSRAVCETAAQAAGVPTPPSVLDGDPGENRGESWRIMQHEFVIFYRINPSSKLDGW